jgi:hypothetical protein
MTFVVLIIMTFLLKSSQGTILSENLIEKNGPTDHITLYDVEDDNDSSNESVITITKVSNMIQRF